MGSDVRAQPLDMRKIIRPHCIGFLAALLSGVILVGCGGTDSKQLRAAKRIDPTKTAPVKRPWPTQNEAAALDACRGPVERSSLSTQSKSEITILCARISERVHENTAIMRAVCQELASATSTSDEAASRRTYAECFAGYQRTLGK